jgi:hypothetical protein
MLFREPQKYTEEQLRFINGDLDPRSNKEVYGEDMRFFGDRNQANGMDEANIINVLARNKVSYS